MTSGDGAFGRLVWTPGQEAKMIYKMSPDIGGGVWTNTIPPIQQIDESVASLTDPVRWQRLGWALRWATQDSDQWS
jgi:hypothetical protein